MASTNETEKENQDLENLIEDVGDSLEEGQLPIQVNNHEGLHELEKERIFGRSWVYIGHESEITEPGDYVRRYVVDSPFIFVRGDDDEIRVLFDACAHRGTKVCRAQRGNTSHFRCPYHGWTYDSTGDLVGVWRETDGYPDMDKDENGLAKPRFDSYQGMYFACMDENTPPLEEWLGDMKWYLDLYLGMTEEGLEVLGEPHEYTIPVNWKIGPENFAGDWYHLESTHEVAVQLGQFNGFAPGATILTEGDGYDDTPVNHSTAIGMLPSDPSLNPMAVREDGKDPKPPYLGYQYVSDDDFSEKLNPELNDGQKEIAARMLATPTTLFPNLSFLNILVGGNHVDGSDFAGYLTIRKFVPKSPEETLVQSWILAPRELTDEQKRQVYKASIGTFSPSGLQEQDDFSVWDGLTEASGSTFARKTNFKGNYTMAQDDKMGQTVGHDDLEDITDSWLGPGKKIHNDPQFSEIDARGYRRTWYNMMSKK